MLASSVFEKHAYLYVLLRELESINKILEPLKTPNRAIRAITASDDAAIIDEYTSKLDRALADYQVCHCALIWQ